MTTFIDDDRGHLVWLAQHPGRFVLNTNRNPTWECLILHRATCPRIPGVPSKGEFWTEGVIKHCAEHREELSGFARVECGVGRRTVGSASRDPVPWVGSAWWEQMWSPALWFLRSGAKVWSQGEGPGCPAA